MPARRPLPAHLVEHLRRFSEGGATPVEPRHAASVVVLRPGAGVDPPELYLLRRHRGMAFAGGMAVFPGGGVDERDFDHAVGWAGPTPEEWAARMRVDLPLARALVCAAVRETFEESGVLFAGPTADSIVDDTTGEDWEADRRRLEARELSFTDFLDGRGLVLRSDLLRVWSSWVTPTFEPRRYRTVFFVAELPAGQQTRDVSTESVEAGWMALPDAVEAAEEERMLVLPPQYFTFLEMLEHPTPAAVLEAADRRELATVAPAGVVDGDQAFLELPDHLLELAERQRRGRIR